MTEIFYIFLQIFIIFINFLFPFNLFRSKYLNNFNFFDKININLLLQLNFYLFCSFFKISVYYLIYVIFLFTCIHIVKDKFKIFQNKKTLLNVSLFILIFTSIVFAIAATPTLGWDAISHWFWKTQVFYQGGTLYDFINIPYTFYPHLGPYLWSLFWQTSIIEYEYMGRFIFAFLFISSIFSVFYDVVDKKNFIVLFAAVYLTTDFFALSGYQEYLIFSFLCFFARIIYLFKSEYINSSLFLLLILPNINLILWSKQEGIIISLLLIVTILISIKIKFKEKIFLFFGFVSLVTLHIFLEIYFKGTYGFHEPIYTNLIERLMNFEETLFKIIYITQHLIIASIQRPLFLCSVIVSLFMSITYKNFIKENSYYFIFLFFIICLIYAIFLHSRYPVETMIPMVLDRLLLQFSGFFIIIFLYFAKKNEKKK